MKIGELRNWRATETPKPEDPESTESPPDNEEPELPHFNRATRRAIEKFARRKPKPRPRRKRR